MSQTESPWDRARETTLIRGNHITTPGPIEPGVNYFVLKLEEVGCKTVWSCEGHPYGFQVLFRGPIAVAKAITTMGIFEVGLAHPFTANGLDAYEINLYGIEGRSHIKPEVPPWSEERRVEVLRLMSRLWEKALVDLIADWTRLLDPRSAAGEEPISPCIECADQDGCRSLHRCARYAVCEFLYGGHTVEAGPLFDVKQGANNGASAHADRAAAAGPVDAGPSHAGRDRPRDPDSLLEGR